MKPRQIVARTIVASFSTAFSAWTTFINIEFAEAERSWSSNDIPFYPGGLCILDGRADRTSQHLRDRPLGRHPGRLLGPGQHLMHTFDWQPALCMTVIYAAILIPAYCAVRWVWRNVR